MRFQTSRFREKEIVATIYDTILALFSRLTLVIPTGLFVQGSPPKLSYAFLLYYTPLIFRRSHSV